MEESHNSPHGEGFTTSLVNMQVAKYWNELRSVRVNGVRGMIWRSCSQVEMTLQKTSIRQQAIAMDHVLDEFDVLVNIDGTVDSQGRITVS